MSNTNERTAGAMGNFAKLSPMDFETVAASQTAQIIGSRGAIGDFVHSVVITSNTAATATVTLLDGAVEIPLLVGSATTPLGVFTVILDAASTTGPWKVTTGAGATVVVTGLFS